MFSLVFLLCCVGALVSSAPQKSLYNIEDAASLFEDFVKTYNKEYTSEAEKQARFEIFKNNLKDINKKNQSSQSAVFGINQFADLTQEEFSQKYTLRSFGNIKSEAKCSYAVYNGTRVGAPESFDWRDQNKVTPVKNQQHCGSCWAFSTVGTVEGQYAMKYNQLVDLSPQQLVDCGQTTHGCDGGFMSNALLDTIQFGGIMSLQDYPYQASQSACQADASRIAARVSDCREFYFQSEDELKETLATVGPISILVAATQWMTYHGGLVDASHCDQKLDHAVLLVGYGTADDGTGRPYWTIKNSWGTEWGDEGYIKITRNENTCNLMGGQFVTAVVQ
ncbi:hypothetical protein ABMA27_013603 [Loxostege sticticalis]|uniref:Uncharacterized protein n=1 Tax=Loxostege sticticalis TaxID=481309 RepID=A0ABR3IFV6_LOXSC